MDSFKGKGEFRKRVKIRNGRGEPDSFKWVECDDEEKVKLLIQLTRTISKLSVDNLRITDEEVISKEQLILFGKAILSLAERVIGDEDKFRG